MKDPQEYLDMAKLAFKSTTLKVNIIENWIKQAQIDAYNEALEDADNNATVEVLDHEELRVDNLPGYTKLKGIVILPIYGVDSDSILNLKKS